jgi:chromosome segregation ATPase
MDSNFQPTAFEYRLREGRDLDPHEESTLKSISQDIGMLELSPYSLAIVISELQSRIEDLETELRELREDYKWRIERVENSLGGHSYLG